MPTTHRSCASVLVHGLIVVIGGYDKKSKEPATLELLDPRKQEWTSLESIKRNNCTAAVVNSRVIVVGGFDGSKARKLTEMLELSEQFLVEKQEEINAVGPRKPHSPSSNIASAFSTTQQPTATTTTADNEADLLL